MRFDKCDPRSILTPGAAAAPQRGESSEGSAARILQSPSTIYLFSKITWAALTSLQHLYCGQLSPIPALSTSHALLSSGARNRQGTRSPSQQPTPIGVGPTPTHSFNLSLILCLEYLVARCFFGLDLCKDRTIEATKGVASMQPAPTEKKALWTLYVQLLSRSFIHCCYRYCPPPLRWRCHTRLLMASRQTPTWLIKTLRPWIKV